MGFLTESEILELSPSELLPHPTPIPTQTARGNNARLYGIGPNKDRFARMKDEYEKNGPGRSNLRYGYVNRPVDWSAFA
jgi:hypothetical protein